MSFDGVHFGYSELLTTYALTSNVNEWDYGGISLTGFEASEVSRL